MLANIIVAMSLVTIVHHTNYQPWVVNVALFFTAIVTVEWVKEKNNWKH